MKLYNTLIIGSGYSSIGYATASPETVICEEHQICDTGFYLPLRSFRYNAYSPKTDAGSELLGIFSSLSLFGANEQNANGFEFAMCKYIAKKQLDVLLKCRVVSIVRQPDLIYDVTVHTNEGLSHLFAKKVLDMSNRADEGFFTVLFICDDVERVKDRLLSAYSSAQIEPAFYSGRYALHISAHGTDENRIKLEIYEKWRSLGIDAKILYMAPVFYGKVNADKLCDYNYDNPIEAFEAGYFCAKENEK